MKKIFSTLAVAGMLFVMAACSSNPAQKAIKIYEDATVKIENAKDMKEVAEIQKQLAADIEKLGKIEAKGDDSVKLAEAIAKYVAAAPKGK